MLSTDFDMYELLYYFFYYYCIQAQILILRKKHQQTKKTTKPLKKSAITIYTSRKCDILAKATVSIIINSKGSESDSVMSHSVKKCHKIQSFGYFGQVFVGFVFKDGPK